MKKLLVCLALVLAFAVIFVACNKDEPEDTTAPVTDAKTEAPTTEAPTTEAPTDAGDDTTDGATTEEPTEAPTTEGATTEEPTTEAPTDAGDDETTTEAETDPVEEGIPAISAGNGMMSPDTYKENGVIMQDGAANVWIANNRADGITGVDNIGFRGWAFLGDGKTVEIADFGYGFKQVEGITWGFAPIADENLYAPLEGRTAVRRYDITIDLTGLETGEYDVFLYVKDAEGNVYCLDGWGEVWVNHVNSFETNSYEATAQNDVDAGYNDSILADSELALGFANALFATADGTIKTLDDGTAIWQFGGFFQTYQAATGKYFYTVDILSAANGASAAFVRGTMGDHFGWDPGYYGEAGAGTPHTKACGKAGIYYNVRGEDLVITIKAVVDNGAVPTIHEIIIPGCTGNITVVDLGDVIYFKSADKTVAKVIPVGSRAIGANEGITESVTVQTWDGQTVEIANAMVVADVVGSEFGFANRVGTMQVKGFAYGSAAGVEYAASLDVATAIVTDKASYAEGEFIYVSASYKEAALIGIAPAGTTDWITYYTMGEKEGFADIPVGDYMVAITDMSGNVLKSVTIKVNPSNIVTAMDAATLATKYSQNAAAFGTNISLSEDGTYITLTMNDGTANATDYNWYFAMGTADFNASAYMVMKYRTSATNIDKNELFMGTALTAWPFNYNFTDKIVCDGEWNYLYINFEEIGVTDMETLQFFRLDLINGSASGSTIDVEFINFYKTAEDAIAATMEPKTYTYPTDYATANNIFSGSCGNAGFEAVYGAINGNMGGTAHAEGYPGINGGDLLWLSNTETTLDLSKYSKMVITYTCDTSAVTQQGYNDKGAGNNKFEVLNFNGTLATAEYTLTHNSWCWNTCEVDLTGVDYNGEILLRMWDGGIPGTWYVIESIVLVP